MAAITVDRSTNVDDAYSMTGSARLFTALAAGSTTAQYNATGIVSPWVTTGAVMPTATNWQSLCYGNNLVVAVSSTSGTIAASSPDGATWTARTMPATASWYAIAYGLDLFVSITGGSSTIAASSPDGANWTQRTLPTAGDWRSLAFGQGTFVALSYGSTDAAYSTNGTSWSSSGALPAARNWTDVCWGENTFVAVASGTDRGAYSTDAGLTWQEMTMPSSSNWRSVTYGNGVFVAVSNTSGTVAASSPDGITWTPRTLPATAAWVSVKFGNNRFIAVSTSSTNAAASDDGFSWRAITLLSQAVSCMAFTPFTWNSGDTLTITNNSTVTINTDQSKFWSGITLTNGKLVISNSSTSTGVRFTMGQTTTDAVSNIVPGSGIGDIEISGNWISLGTGDGTSGQTMTAPFRDNIPALWVETAAGSGVYEQWLNVTGTYGDTSTLLWNGLAGVGSGARGKFFIQQAASTPYGPTILNGTAGARAQRLVTVTSTTGLYPGASIRGPGIPLNTVVNRVISSTLLELSAVTTTELSPDWSSVAYGAGVYVAVSTSQSNIAATSTDGVTWTKQTLPFVAHWTSVCYGSTSGLFVAVASDSVNYTTNTSVGVRFCATSADGVTWTRRAMPLPSNLAQNWNCVATNGTSYVAVGSLADGTATTVGAYSADGITWSSSTMTSAIWRSVTYGAGSANRYVAVSSTTISNWDADGTGTWTNGGAMTSGNYLSIAWNGTRFLAVSGSTTGCMYSTDATSWTAGATLPNSTSRGVAWDGTNFVVVSTTNSVNTSRSPNGSTAWTNTTMASTHANNWTAICANGSTLVAVSSSSNLRSAAMTSTDSGANWTLQTGTPMDVSLTCFNPFVSQLTNVVQFGDNVNGNKVPTGANVRCPNIMFTCATPASVKTAAGRTFGANILMVSGSLSGGSVIADKCLFDDSYNNFTQSEILTLTNVAFSTPPLIAECYNLTINSMGLALEPVRRYYQVSATFGSYGWFTRDLRFGNSSANTWSYLNGASITDLNMVVGMPTSLTANQTGATVTAPGFALAVTNTQDSTWTNLRFYGLLSTKNFQAAISANTLFNDNTITNFESYGLAPIYLGTSSGNTITNVTFAEDMFNCQCNTVTGKRIGNEPITGNKLSDNTKYYLKTRSFRDWTNRAAYYESRVYSATPFLGSKWFPQALSAVWTGPRQITLNWYQRNPTSATVAYTIFRGTTAGFTRDSSTRLFYSPTATVVAYANGFVATATASGGRTITFNQAARTITASSGSFITDGFVIGANVVASGFSSNNGTYMILSLTATVLTLTTNHTNLTTSAALTSGTLSGEPPVDNTTYYYRLLKLDSALSGITNAAGTAAGTTLTIPSGSFNTGLGTILNCEGVAGQNKIRIPAGSTTNFLAGNVSPGMQISGGGVAAGATVVSVDSLWQITVSAVNDSTFSATTLSLGAAAGLYIYGPGIAWPTKVVSVDTSQSITVDTPFLATFSGQIITFMYGTESQEIEVPGSAMTTPAFNFLTQSDDFTHANWVKTNITATAAQALAPIEVPFGSNITYALNADRLFATGPTATAVQTITNLDSGSDYTFSVYVMTVPFAHTTTVEGSISVNTTSPTTQAFTATNAWQRITAPFTATSGTHTFTISISTQGAFIYAATAQVNPGSSALPPVTTTTVKLATGSGGRTFTFASSSTVNTITASSGSFTTDGFVAGDSIIVAGTTSNDGTYLVTVVAATILTISPAQPLVAEGPISTGTITGSVLAAAGLELTAAYAWGRSTSGNTANQGIDLTLATAPAGQHYAEIYLGTTSNFTPSDYNRVGVTYPGSIAPFSLNNSSNNKIDTVTQLGAGGLSGALTTLSGSSGNKFFNFTTDFNFSVGTAMLASVQNLSNDNTYDNFTVKGWRNYIANITPFTLANNASGLTISNISFDTYDFPIYHTSTNSALGITMKGVSGGSHTIVNAATLTNQNLDILGTSINTMDGIGVVFVTVYDTIFHETYTSPTTGTLQLRFNASALDTPPYEILAGTPTFSNDGKLYLRNVGDSIEYTWPHRIYTVSGFRDLVPKLNSLDLGHTNALDAAYAVLVEYAIDTGSGYGAFKRATPTNLAGESVSTTTGFLLKLRFTVRAGMMFSTQTNPFVVGETIEGTTSGATAVVDEIYQLTTTSGTIILSSVTGTFLPTELVRRDSDNQTRATNVVTNTQFALFPSFNSYINGFEIYTNSVGPGDYPGQTISIVLTNLVVGSRYYVYRTANGELLGSGTAASSTVTVTGVTYVADFGITVRVRKASSVPKYVPLVTQATVNSAGASVYIGQIEDSIAS